MRTKLLAATMAGGAVLLSTFALSGSAAASGYGDDDHDHVLTGRLNSLNNSGVTGPARVRVDGTKVRVHYTARHVAPNLPHAAHIHYGEQAAHECPTVADDANRDFRLNVAEGLPRYGPIVISLTTKGDSSPASALAVDRFSTAPKGTIYYNRKVSTSKAVAEAIRHGEGVLVVHGVDYNHNGTYDFDGAGASELNSAVPAEATDPAACTVLR